ncbi:hypothetical protein BN126360082 [Stenotrophomonas indicatrix]|nr:hypothetical protein BN126360082 [Stenotrophomonas indicatrix]
MSDTGAHAEDRVINANGPTATPARARYDIKRSRSDRSSEIGAGRNRAEAPEVGVPISKSIAAFQPLYGGIPTHSTRELPGRWYCTLVHTFSKPPPLRPKLSTCPRTHLCDHPARTAVPNKAEQAWSKQHATR